MKFPHKIFLTVILLQSLQAYAGWIGGGGKHFRDELNPWFINHKDYTFCIDADESKFSVDQSLTGRLIQEQLEYWRRNLFGMAKPIGLKDFSLAQHKVKWRKCDGNQDLTFYLGHLPKDIEEDYLPFRDEYYAVSVRTDYDDKRLRAKGFIYVMPDMVKASTKIPKFKKNLWSLDENHIFELVLKHELGHLFGISHSEGVGVSGNLALMSEGFVDVLIKNYITSGRIMPVPRRLFNPNGLIEYTHHWAEYITTDLTDVINLPSDIASYRLSGNLGKGYIFSISTLSRPNFTPYLKISSPVVSNGKFDDRALIYLYMTKRQTHIEFANNASDEWLNKRLPVFSTLRWHGSAAWELVDNPVVSGVAIINNDGANVSIDVCRRTRCSEIPQIGSDLVD